ncbi:ERCC4-domain-containing protein, partial [Gonapodya prolifera JEL478]
VAIPIDSDGRVVPDADDGLFANSGIAGGRSVLGRIVPTIVIDSRELRSSLPSMLHAKGYKLAVRTLEVGDYVLTPNICVERKSILDWIGSDKNGKLRQPDAATCRGDAMNAHYKFPTVLIEFDANKAFSFQVSLRRNSSCILFSQRALFASCQSASDV